MVYRQQLNSAIELIIQTESPHIDYVEEKIIDDYKKLNEKCDDIITKIKIRKDKNKKT